MKYLILAITLFGELTYACPDLSGSFVHTSESGTVSKTLITQTEVDGITTYLMKTNEAETTIIADDKMRITKEEEDGYISTTKMTFTCAENELILVYSVSTVDADGVLDSETVGTKRHYLDSNKNIISKYAFTESESSQGNSRIFAGTSVYVRQ